MNIDTAPLRAFIEKEIAECRRSLDNGMAPQGDESVREELRDLRAIATAITSLERLATEMAKTATPAEAATAAAIEAAKGKP